MRGEAFFSFPAVPYAASADGERTGAAGRLVRRPAFGALIRIDLMPAYHSFRTMTVDPTDRVAVAARYAEGFVFTRRGNTVMQQARSVRVPLRNFVLSSENRRVMKRTAEVALRVVPLVSFSYQWQIGKMAKDFYARFGARAFSANKVKELFTSARSPMNTVLAYGDGNAHDVGYCLAYALPSFLHYAYPFYEHARDPSLGMAMMTKAVFWAQDAGKEYIYLGSVRDEQSLYKFQFNGIEWFDGQQWRQGKPSGLFVSG